MQRRAAATVMRMETMTFWRESRARISRMAKGMTKRQTRATKAPGGQE